MCIGRSHPEGIEDSITTTQTRRRPASRTVASDVTKPTPTAGRSAEDELRDYMQVMKLNRYGHAAALLSQRDASRDR